MNSSLNKYIKDLDISTLSNERRSTLDTVKNNIQSKIERSTPVKLHFICTHNSRRSQLAQIWAQTISVYYGVYLEAFSGGVEVTAFNETAVHSLKKAGFEVVKEGILNPVYTFTFDSDKPSIKAWSKLFDDATNPQTGFAALMTCADADENCPFIPGAEKRLPLRYDDPKISDGTTQEEEVYAARSKQIATEMKYIFSTLNS
ncbi:protein-tyrosine-phosphatase [Leeuwenhoekiella sp. MAR_2009_132]|uniref:protein-tyrosine-phosphatase n=1 Tax=Leeuwenhoekiella sp. MAR_2009_132 TaxID=1392489 RepID=UPI00068FFD60|nr:protein-tyrosine-phosphatase [Leeuwenhoekiella sp. MAR_2009_132]